MAGGVGRRRQRDDRGSAAVEFALVVPLLLLILFGVISYGYMLSFRQALSQGAAEGARAAAVTTTATPAGQSAAGLAALNSALDTYGVSCSGGALVKGGATVGTCSLTVATCSNDPSAQCATLAVVYQYAAHPLIPNLPLVPNPTVLQYSAVSRVS